MAVITPTAFTFVVCKNVVVEIPDEFIFALTVTAVRMPTLYGSAPVPVIPLSSLLTNSYQLFACEKYPFPVA